MRTVLQDVPDWHELVINSPGCSPEGSRPEVAPFPLNVRKALRTDGRAESGAPPVRDGSEGRPEGHLLFVVQEDEHRVGRGFERVGHKQLRGRKWSMDR